MSAFWDQFWPIIYQFFLVCILTDQKFLSQAQSTRFRWFAVSRCPLDYRPFYWVICYPSILNLPYVFGKWRIVWSSLVVKGMIVHPISFLFWFRDADVFFADHLTSFPMLDLGRVWYVRGVTSSLEGAVGRVPAVARGYGRITFKLCCLIVVSILSMQL